MLTPTIELLSGARGSGYAVGAFNVYNLEGVKAVLNAAVQERSPVMLQIHPSALAYGGRALVALCVTASSDVDVPVAVHLDHSSSKTAIREALAANVSSVMADGSHLPYEENITFTKEMTDLAHERGIGVEAELGRISGTEDGLTVPEFEARFTDPEQAVDFVDRTRVDALAVCIGNVHGRYPREPRLDFERLAAIGRLVTLPLVLHGTSGLPDEMIRQAIELGVTKFNVNTEVRQTYLAALRERIEKEPSADLLDIMGSAVSAMQEVVAEKLRLFKSAGRI